ncbi:hypothetical protein DTO195F2_7867 [Paecilomyces variotii]|nr:hypothetical protein DTO195F2_7867 [Paecilomyces variotii]
MRQTPDDASRSPGCTYGMCLRTGQPADFFPSLKRDPDSDLEWFGRGLPRQHHNLQMSFPITRDKFHILSAGSKNVPECDPPLRTSPLSTHDLTKSRVSTSISLESARRVRY